MNFDSDKTIRYWKESAYYDLETADSLFQSQKYPYALFFGHLALEKLLKAIVVKATQEHAPFTHSLTLLASKTSIDFPENILEQLARFMEFHFEARYPDDKKKFYKKCTENFTSQNLSNIKEVFQWLTRKL